MRTNGQIKIARPSWLPLKQGTVSRQSRKRKFPSQLRVFTERAGVSPMAPGPCMELPPASAGAPHPGPVHAPLILHRETPPRLCSTPGSCKDSFPARQAGPRGPGSLWCLMVTTCRGAGGVMGEGRGRAGRESRAPSHACPPSVGGPGSLGGAASIPAPSSPLPPTLIFSDSGWEAGKAGAPAVEAPEPGSALLHFPLLYLEAYVTGMASQR